MQNNILIAVSGLTPQIITEAFYCLVKKKKTPINEIYILTTSRGRDVINGNDDKIKYPPLKNEIKNLCKKYNIPVPKFENNDKHIIVAKEQSLELSDIRTDKHNILFPNKICEFIDKASSDTDNTLYCCISGGRKTMSVYLAFALSLFGRYNDKLVHVLTKEENEFKNFYPQNPKEDKELEIAEIPFVRLAKYLKEKRLSGKLKKFKYDELVKSTQNEISPEDETKMYINVQRSFVMFAGNEQVKLPPKEMELYSYLVSKVIGGVNSVSIKELTVHLYGEKMKGNDNTLSVISKLNRNIVNAVNNPDYNNLYRITGPKEHGHGYYGILQDGMYFEIIE